MAEDLITAVINGVTYEGWTELTTDRSIEHCASTFDIAVTERWAGQGSNPPWQIKPFDPCQIYIGSDLELTGNVDEYLPAYDAETHTVRITGRSKTADIVDCMPDIQGGQFNGYTLDKIAKAVAAPFGVNVVVAPGTDVGGAIPNATMEKVETAYAFLEKLCRLQGVLVFDDENGNLVLAQAGTAGSAGALLEGQNILAASGKLSGAERFSQYAVLAQAPLAYDGQDAQLEIIGKATDAGCPRYRRFAESSEDPADTALANRRAKWRALHNCGAGTNATLTVGGHRQPDGSLWRVNQLVPVTSPRLQLDREFMVGGVKKSIRAEGRRTILTLAPQEAYSPQPPKAKKPKNGKSSALWNEAEGIN